MALKKRLKFLRYNFGVAGEIKGANSPFLHPNKYLVEEHVTSGNGAILGSMNVPLTT